MAKFAYNNTKNTNTGYIPLELNYRYYLYIFFEKNTNLCSQSKIADMLLAKLKEVIIFCCKNFYYVSKIPKQAYNKNVKPKNDVSGNKILLYSKYIKSKCNRKQNAKFLELFRLFYLIRKKAYKLELLKK